MGCTPQGNWNKETMIRKTLEETPASDAEWIMWVDIDTVMPDMAVLPRFEAYEGYNLVVWGNRDKIMEGDMNGGALASSKGVVPNPSVIGRCVTD